MTNAQIIFIDDDDEELDMIAAMARTMYYPAQVKTFNKPHELIEFLMISEKKLLCIVSDVNMPKLSGFELRAEVMKTAPALSDVPFILLSSSRSEAEMARADALSIKGYYTKTDSFAGMKNTLESIMSIIALS